MRQDQLWHAIRAACAILEADDVDHVIVIGSQSILGTYNEAQLPRAATMSREVDILPPGVTDEDTERMAELLAGVAGEWSLFDQTHGFYLDGVDTATAVLPTGWRNRLVQVSNASTINPITGQVYSGLCLEPHDLCAAKACALRDKDKNFIRALIEAGIVDRGVIIERLTHLGDSAQPAAMRAISWLSSPTRVVPDAGEQDLLGGPWGGSTQ